MIEDSIRNRYPKLWKPQVPKVLRKTLCLVLFIAIFPNASWAQVDLVSVDKSKRIMTLIDDERPLKQFKISLGASPKGHKTEEGDERTPEGRYLLDYIKEDSDYYRAVHISYPNKTDRSAAKQTNGDPGGFIMVHGQKNGFGWLSWVVQNFDWTDGCIAITNSEMDYFIQKVPVGTPIDIRW